MLLTAHRVLFFQEHGLNIVKLFKLRNAVALVGFYADDNFTYAQRLGNVARAARNFFGVFKHKSVVAGQVRFALCAVYYKRVYGCAGGNLYRRWEARAAKPYNAAVLNALLYCFRVGSAQRGKGYLFAASVALNYNVRFRLAVCAGKGFNIHNFARNAGKHVRRDCPVRYGEQFALSYLCALFNFWHGGLAQRLRQGNINFLRQGHSFRLLPARERLVVAQVYAGEEGFAFNCFHCVPPNKILKNKRFLRRVIYFFSALA